MVKRNLMVVAALAALASAMPASAATSAWFTFESLTLNGVAQPNQGVTGGGSASAPAIVINKANTAGTWVVGVNMFISTTDNLFAWNYDLQSPDATAANGSQIKGIAGVNGFQRLSCPTPSGVAFDGTATPGIFGSAGAPGATGVIYNDMGGANTGDVPNDGQEQLNTASCLIARIRFQIVKPGLDGDVFISAATGGQGTFGGDNATGAAFPIKTLFAGNQVAINGDVGQAGGRQVTAFPVITVHNVPEPATIALLGLGALMAIRRKR